MNTHMPNNNLESKSSVLFDNLKQLFIDDSDFLDFKNSNVHDFSHGYHMYPAVMIPQLPRLFIEKTRELYDVKNVFDPFMGSGTTLVESSLAGLNSYGTDLNPLAVLISKVKTTYINPNKLENSVKRLFDDIKKNNSIKYENPDFKNINFWFKDDVIQDLMAIKKSIDDEPNEDIRNFFLVCFSMTIRYSSLQRNNEFKNYRMSADKIDDWNPDTIDFFMKKIFLNKKQNLELKDLKGEVSVNWGDSRNLSSIEDETFDLLITSPPYGDSHTTVAYGQFSRLSLQWLGLEENEVIAFDKVDKHLLGGDNFLNLEISDTDSVLLNNSIKEIAKLDVKRAKEVLKFYLDIEDAISEIARVMKKGSIQYWVTGNRTVKGITLPTDLIISELFKKYGIKKIGEFSREISNKRMPKKVSPTNEKGKQVKTMSAEIIAIYEKE